MGSFVLQYFCLLRISGDDIIPNSSVKYLGLYYLSMQLLQYINNLCVCPKCFSLGFRGGISIGIYPFNFLLGHFQSKSFVDC